MTSDSSAYARFRRTLQTGNLNLVRAAAAELPRIDLRDALTICTLLAEREPEHYERAALRWLSRFCREQPAVSLADAARAADSLRLLRHGDKDARDELRRLLV